MSWTDLAGDAIGRIVGRLTRRAAGWTLVAIFALAAIYQATVAISVALELEFGVVRAHLMIAAFYALAASITVLVLWFTTRRTAPDEKHAGISRLPPKYQIATIVEAMLLGYSMSRKKK
jgi:hypothetical protein